MMNKKLLLTLLFPFVIYSAGAQEQDSLASDTAWKFSGITSLNFSQVYMKNWSAGGVQSIAGNALANLSADYKKGKVSWENDLILAYGLVKTGEEDYRKAEDKIDFTTKYGLQGFDDNFYYTALINFKSQFAPGYNYPDDSTIISDFLAPAYALLSLGLDYQKSEGFSIYFSPLTAKITIVNNDRLSDAGAYGVEPAQYNSNGEKIKDGESMFTEFGGYLKMSFSKTLIENVLYETKLELFSSYSEDPTHIDVNWDNTLAFKVNKYISANITTRLIYDDDIDIAVDNNDDGIVDKFGPRTQFMETFNLGIQYTFSK